MAIDSFKVKKSLNIAPGGTIDSDGDIKVDSAGSILQVQLGGVSDNIVTAAAIQTLTNKTIDFSTNTITNLPITPLPPDVVTESAAQILSAKIFGDVIGLVEQTSTATPASGRVNIYAKTDGKVYKKTSAGVETEIGSGSAGTFVGFRAIPSVAKNNITVMDYDNELYDYGNGYNPVNSTYTAPVAGVYYFDVNAIRGNGAATLLHLRVNGNRKQAGRIYTTSSYDSIIISAEIELAANDVVDLEVDSGLAGDIILYPLETSFSGSLAAPAAFVEESHSEITLEGGAGNGSTNTQVRRFQSVRSSVGSDLTYTADAALGDTITVNKDGTYSITYFDYNTTAGAGAGVTLNDSGGNTNINSEYPKAIINFSLVSAYAINGNSVVRFLYQGDVLRCRNVGNAVDGVDPAATIFSVTKIVAREGAGPLNKVPTIQTLTAASGTYITPSNPTPAYLKIRMVGGGGGGAGSYANTPGGPQATDGADGGTTIFGSPAILSADGGGKGIVASFSGAGGTGTINSPAYGTAFAGSAGEGCEQESVGSQYRKGGDGGNSVFGGGGRGAINSPGGAGVANSGSGGAGGGMPQTTGYTGPGGGAGAYVEAIIPSPVAGYAYIVGAGGAGGNSATANSYGGASGADGIIIVEEYYQ